MGQGKKKGHPRACAARSKRKEKGGKKGGRKDLVTFFLTVFNYSFYCLPLADVRIAQQRGAMGRKADKEGKRKGRGRKRLYFLPHFLFFLLRPSGRGGRRVKRS